MKIRTKLAACAACIMAAGILTVPAMAHGHHSGHAQSVSYPQCQVEDCQLTEQHSHDGVVYCGHTLEDGHSQHAACDVAGCTSLGEHTHRSGGRHGHHC